MLGRFPHHFPGRGANGKHLELPHKSPTCDLALHSLPWILVVPHGRCDRVGRPARCLQMTTRINQCLRAETWWPS